MALQQQEFDRFKKNIFDAIWRDLDPLEEEIEATGRLPYDKLVPLLREMGAFKLAVPAEYGGLGLSTLQYIEVLKEFAKVQGGIRVLVHVHNSMAHAISKLADDRHKQEILPKCADGTYSVAFALTEPDHGTGADIGTTAEPDGDGYLINGRKWLISNSDIASHFIVFARTGGRADPKEISAFIVRRDMPGLSIEPLPETMGCRGGEHGLLTFINVRVHERDFLSKKGQGLSQMEEALEISRVYVAASSLGNAEYALELSLKHAKERTTFGRPIAQRQAVQRYLAEMATDVYALKNMIWDAADKWDRGLRIPAEASMCKLFGLEAVARVTDRALLVHGGIGYTRKHKIERLYRDARLNYLEEGTPTIQYMVTAQSLYEGYDFYR